MSPLLTESNESVLSYSGELFASLHNSILITFNFRSSLFSDLYLDSIYQANLGLFDQNLAFEWAKKYINEFCGDNTKLTVIAHSASADLLGIHLISKYSRHLIDNAIIQSKARTFFSGALPKTKNEMIINSFSAIQDLGCLNLSKNDIIIKDGELDEEIKLKYFSLIDDKYNLNKNLFLQELNENQNKLPCFKIKK